MRSDNTLGVLAVAMLLAGIAVRPDADTQLAQDALWSVGAQDSADAPAGKGLPSDIVPDDLLLARWAVAAGVADREQALALRDEASARRAAASRDAPADEVEFVAEADTLYPR